MLDEVHIELISGNGGDGAISGRREKFVPLGGPDGGDGGNGGSIFLKADSHTNTLMAFHYKKRFSAQNGGNGLGKMKHGKKGSDTFLAVPEGTEVWQESGESVRLADLTSVGDEVMVAAGGSGGRGNARFTSSTNRYPHLAEQGERGERVKVKLSLKLLADVGIVGIPNAGKSSLLRAISAARPKVADYPFTTLEPVLGAVEHKAESFVAIDIPGLLEGAHEGVGLGDTFLRHIERTRVLIHVIDGSEPDLMGRYQQIQAELDAYGGGLTEREQVVAINKTDIEGVGKMAENGVVLLGEIGRNAVPISAAGRVGLEPLLDKVTEMLAAEMREKEAAPATPQTKQLTVLRPRPVDEQVVVTRSGRKFVVGSSRAQRIAPMVQQSDWRAKVQFHEHLRRTGVLDALEKAGIKPGQKFKVGVLEMEWEG